MKILFILFFLFITHINANAEITTNYYKTNYNNNVATFVPINAGKTNTSDSETETKSTSNGILQIIFDMIKSLYEMFINLLKTLVGQLKTTLNTKSDVM